MDVFLTRSAIRQKVCDLTGYSADATMSAPAIARLNAYIDMAASQVAAQSRWLSLRRRATLLCGSSVSWSAIEQARWLE
jgi:hypothetical protein